MCTVTCEVCSISHHDATRGGPSSCVPLVCRERNSVQECSALRFEGLQASVVSNGGDEVNPMRRRARGRTAPCYSCLSTTAQVQGTRWVQFDPVKIPRLTNTSGWSAEQLKVLKVGSAFAPNHNTRWCSCFCLYNKRLLFSVNQSSKQSSKTVA